MTVSHSLIREQQRMRSGDQEMEIELVPSSERAVAAAWWQELADVLQNSNITNSWPWVAAWTQCFGDRIPHSFAFALRQNRPVGAALVTQAPLQIGPVAVPALFLGTAGEGHAEPTFVQYNRVLVADAELEAFAGCLLARLMDLPWSVLRLQGFVPEHAEALIGAGQQLGLRFHVDRFQAFTHVLREEAFASLSHDTRSKLRRSMRILAKELGPLSTEWAETPAQPRDILCELIELHTSQWQARGETGALHTERLRNYHLALIDELFPQHAILFRARQGETTIGCLFNLVEGGHVTNHRSGIRFFPDDNRLKPGYVTDLLFMEEAQPARL